MSEARLPLVPSLVLGGLTALWLWSGWGPDSAFFGVSQGLKLFGVLGGASLCLMSPLFKEDSSFEPIAVLGWLVGVGVAILFFEVWPDYRLAGALLVPVCTLVAILVGGKGNIASPFIPLMACYFALGVWVAQAPVTAHLLPEASIQLLAVTVLLGLLQVGLGITESMGVKSESAW